jgi:hypothetical protein
MALTVEDRLNINDLYARYNHAIDSGNGEAWAGTFTPTGTFTSGGRTQTGAVELVPFAAGFAARLKGRHWTNNLVVDADGDGARGSCYLMLLRLTPGEQPPASVLTTAIYHDTLVKDGGAWKFSSRSVAGDA